MMTFNKLFALAFSFQCLMAQHFNCTDGTCSNSIIQCDNQNITDCIVDCAGAWTCVDTVIYGGSGDLTLSCDGEGSCVGLVIYCPSDSICHISATNGALIDFVFAHASSELSVTLSGNAKLERSKIHCPSLRYDNETACHITVDGQRGRWYNNNAMDTLLIYAMDQPPATDLLLECINPPCDGVATIAYEQNNESVACNIESTVDEFLFPYMDKVSSWQCQNTQSVPEGESCASIPTFVSNEFQITNVSENGKYFYFEDDYVQSGQYDFYETDIWYEPTNEWIAVEISQGENTNTEPSFRHVGHKYPLITAAEGDWEIGATVRRMHYEWVEQTCADGLQCAKYIGTCEKVTIIPTSYPTTSPTSPITTGTTDSSANSFCVGFSLIFGCLFCLIL